MLKSNCTICLLMTLLASAGQSQTVRSFGDSMTSGYSLSNPATQAWPARVAAAEHWTLTNSGVSGSQLTDAQMDQIRSACGTKNNFALLLGYNDMRFGGTDPVALGNYAGALEDAIACLAIPAETRLTGNGPGVSYTGSWHNTPVGGAMGKYTTDASGATVSFTFSGTTLITGTYVIDQPCGTFDIIIDGKSHGTISCAGFRTNGNGRGYSPSAVRVSGLSNTSHTVTLVAHGEVFFDWAAGNSDNASPNKAKVYLGNTLKMTTLGYETGGAPWTSGSDAAVAAYNTVNAKVASDLAADGWNVIYVNASAAYNPNSMVGPDNVHPADPAGTTAIAQAFISAIGGVPTPPPPPPPPPPSCPVQ